jgi:hypothetical protein
MDINWIKSFNELFKKINNQGTPSYFSGPRFISIIQEFDPSFLQYNQYIEYRREKGLSTSRKDFFFDILSKFNDDSKVEILKRIDEEIAKSEKQGKVDEEVFVKSFENWQTENPDSSQGHVKTTLKEWLDSQREKAQEIEREEVAIETEIVENPKVFISYSWDNEDHKNWVLNLAKRLRENGVDAIIDRYELKPGKNMMVFMEQSIEVSDKVLIVFTENYKLKADKRAGGVGYEYSILNADLYQRIADNEKYLPILRSGTFETSVPAFMKQFIASDMSDNNLFEERFNELLLTIYNNPIIEKPEIGMKPSHI